MNDAKFHLFDADAVAGIALPHQFTCPYYYEPHPLALMAVGEVQRYVASRTDWADEMGAGKMLGVLVAQDAEGRLGYLAAFSGNLLGTAKHEFFVPPIYDLSDPQGEFKHGEAEITAINNEIKNIQKGKLRDLRNQILALIHNHDEEIADFKSMMAQHKQERDQRRQQGGMTPAEEEALLNQSRFEKAELRRIRQRIQASVAGIVDEIDSWNCRLDKLKDRRKAMSEALQERIFRLFVVTNARGERRDLVEVFKPLRKLPPAGTGECCAPRMLNYAFNNALRPVCMAEFWWGASPTGEVRHHGHFYPACRSKCKPVLDFMMQGLDAEQNVLGLRMRDKGLVVVYDDRWVTVLNKPAGMLTVPGKLLEDSLLTRYQEKFPTAWGPIVVHRLDQETSGLVIFAKDKDSHKFLQQEFEHHRVRKEYIALLDGIVPDNEGTITLPLRPDVDDRPRQMVDRKHGKFAFTAYEVIDRSNGMTLVKFMPYTGRTHQLRVHASHPQGLNCPIVGDRLYGKAAQRMCLHATSITFAHPSSHTDLTFYCLPDF